MTSASSVAALEELPRFRRHQVERGLVEPIFDRTFYVSSYASAMERDGATDPLDHFLKSGWKSLLKPRADFDTWWYWVNYLDPGSDAINPAVHYVLEGRAAGHVPNPGQVQQRDGHQLPAVEAPRRAILVAGFDAEFVVDDVVVLLIKELARWGDVYYLADNWLPPSELAKLTPHTEGAWGIRHGAYDFGSYSMLARDLVGWEKLSEYDEVIFANDSTFLVRPLDDVFATMAERSCAWWGLQATKGLISTADQPTTRFTSPIPLDTVREDLLTVWEHDAEYDFHVGSYFLAFRKPVISDPVFRRLMDSVHTQNSKRNIVLKYEVGLTHILVGLGHRFDTFVPAVHPLHPLFTDTHFDLIAAGFPFLKRYFLAQNHYDIPGLSNWKERITALAPGAPVKLFESALVRTTGADRLHRSMTLRSGPDGAAVIPKFTRGRLFKRRDAARPKDPNAWVFAVDRHTGRLTPSVRATFERVRYDESIEKVILTRSQLIDLPGANVRTLPLLESESRDVLYRAGVVVLRTGPGGTLRAPISAENHVIVASRDGVSLTPAGHLTARPVDPATRGSARPEEAQTWLHDLKPSPLTGFTAASAADLIAGAGEHFPALYANGWRTGIPAHDFLTAASELLPDDLREQEARLRHQAQGRKIVLLMPSQARLRARLDPLEFTPRFRAELSALLTQRDAVLAIREPAHDFSGAYRQQWPDALDASVLSFESTHAVVRAADLIWTDFDSAALDATLIGKAVVSFTPPDDDPDLTLYDLDHLFPGPVTHREDDLLAQVDHQLAHPEDTLTARYQRFRDLFFEFADDQNASRLITRINQEIDGRKW